MASMAEPRNYNDIRAWSVVRAYLSAASKYPWFFTAAVIATLIVEGENVLEPLYLKQVVDLLSKGTPTEAVLIAIYTALGIYALLYFSGWAGRRIASYLTVELEAEVIRDLFNTSAATLLAHSHEFFISNFTGTLTRRVTRYTRAFESFFDNIIFNFLPAIFFVIGILIVLSLKSILLGLGLLAWTLLFIGIQYAMVRYYQPLRIERSAADSATTGTLSDAVLNHATITTFASLDRERSIFGKVVDHWYTATRNSWLSNNYIAGVQGVLVMAIEFIFFVLIIYFWQQGTATVGDFVLIQAYLTILMDRIWGIGRNMRELYDVFADATEMLDIIELPNDIVDAPDARPLAVREGQIVFDHVRFEYRDGQTVFEDCDITIAPHEKVAFVGPSGAGKSTITKLLLRLYNVSGGAITIDGQDIALATQESVREAIAFVPQEQSLFHRTLMENIRYGRADATDDEVIEAAKQAHCLEFIERYSDGFDTMVGERGVKLSGGERQRVAIARAILKNAPILVLDEATSSLDSESESLIQDALAKLMQGKTVIAIAHRLSTIMHMDRIIVMENGRIALSGTHTELLSQESNLYKKLWEIQAGGFIAEDEDPI